MTKFPFDKAGGSNGSRGKAAGNEKSAASERSEQKPGFILGRYLAGDLTLSVLASVVICCLEDLKRHLVILGKTGKGKTTTARIILEGVARLYGDAQIFFIDGNNDPGMARMFGGSLTALGRKPRFFPRERFNTWATADWAAVRNRLLEIIPFSRQGDGAFYTSRASVILYYAVRMDGRPPGSITELLDRLNYGEMIVAFGPAVFAANEIEKEDVANVRMRVMEIYTHIGSSLDGKWSFKDVDSAYFALDSLALGRENAVVTLRLLLAQLTYYIEHEKDRDRPCVVVIDEFASFAGGVEIGMFIEHARKLGVIVIVMSQTVAGMGNPEQRARVLHNAELVLCHTTPEWHEVQELISLQTAPEMTLRHGNAIGEPDLRLVEKPKVTKADLLGSKIGEGWLFCDAKAMKLAMHDPGAAPEFELPEQEELFDAIEYQDAEASRSADAFTDTPEPPPWREDRTEEAGNGSLFSSAPIIPDDVLASLEAFESTGGGAGEGSAHDPTAEQPEDLAHAAGETTPRELADEWAPKAGGDWDEDRIGGDVEEPQARPGPAVPQEEAARPEPAPIPEDEHGPGSSDVLEPEEEFTADDYEIEEEEVEQEGPAPEEGEGVYEEIQSEEVLEDPPPDDEPESEEEPEPPVDDEPKLEENPDPPPEAEPEVEEKPVPDQDGDGADDDAPEADGDPTGREAPDQDLTPEEGSTSTGGKTISVGGGLLGTDVPKELLIPEEEDDDWAKAGAGGDEWATDPLEDNEEWPDEMSNAFFKQVEHLRGSEDKGAEDENERK